MLVPRSWLKEFVEVDDLSDQSLSEVLISLGHEVEEIIYHSPMDSKIVVAQVLALKPHPDANRLSICTVLLGKNDHCSETLEIVCGADNVQSGIFVPLAKDQAQLENGLKIKQSKIRGQLSSGMICAASELGLCSPQSNHSVSNKDGDSLEDYQLCQGYLDGIVNLEHIYPFHTYQYYLDLDSKSEYIALENLLNQPIEQIFKFKDTVFDLSITPNRSDCQSIFGIARDLAAKLDRQLYKPNINLDFSDKNTSDFIKVNIKSADLSNRFSALYLDNFTENAKSPLWMQRRLRICGQDSVNLIVDCANYIRIELGQPIHTYDYQKLDNNTLNVYPQKGSQSFFGLDQKQYQLKDQDIVIGDQSVYCLAGIMGSDSSAIDHLTKSCVIEGAHFNSHLIRKTHKRLGIESQAGYLFSRGIDIANIDYCVNKVAELIKNCFRSLRYSKSLNIYRPIDLYLEEPKSKKIALRVERARKILGINNITWQQASSILQRLGCSIVDRVGSRLLVEVSSFRCDLEREVDLIEELGRVIGYEKIPPTIPRLSKNSLSAFDPIDSPPKSGFYQFCINVKTSLAHFGLHEVILYPFANEQDYQKCLIKKGHGYYPNLLMANPISSQFDLMLTLPMVSLLRSLMDNLDNHRTNIKLFQVSRAYHNYKENDHNQVKLFCSKNQKHYPLWFSAYNHDHNYDHCYHNTTKETTKEVIKEPGDHPIERTVVSVLINPPWKQKGWQNNQNRDLDFFDIKSVVNELFCCLGLRNYQLSYEKIDAVSYPFLNPSISSLIVSNNQYLGFVGGLHPKAGLNWGLAVNNLPYICELDLENLFLLGDNQSEFCNKASLNNYPPCFRDLAIVVEQGVCHRDILNTINAHPNKKHLDYVDLFDVYQGEGIKSGYKSMGYSLVFCSTNQTLKDKQVNKEFDSLVKYLDDKLGAKLRTI